MSKITLALWLAVWLALGCEAVAAPERLVGGPCDGCDAVFEGRPAKLSSSTPIASRGEPGARLVVTGTVLDARNHPVAGVIVYAYHTDASGLYPKSPTGTRHRHGRLRGFAVSNRAGQYRFDTIRPAGYPGTELPQHIHMHVVEPGRCHYYLDDLLFADDPRLTAARRKAQVQGRGGAGVVQPWRERDVWWVRRDITLGAGITDYASCGR
ncbi:MAG: hypothetical protein WKG01_24750 [Kofleriaceae bacterium]